VALLARLPRSLDVALRGQRLTAPRVTDRPRLIGWSGLHLAQHRSLTSLVIAAGTAWPVPEPTGSSTKRTPCGVHPTFNPRDLDRRSAAPCGTSEPRSECLPSCRDEPESPLAPSHACPLVWKALRDTRTVLTSESPGRAPARHPEPSSASAASFDLPCGSPYVADARCVGPTFCHLTSSYQYPRLVGSRCVGHLRGLACEVDCLIHVSALRFGGSHVTPFTGRFIAMGVVFPS